MSLNLWGLGAIILTLWEVEWSPVCRIFGCQRFRLIVLTVEHSAFKLMCLQKGSFKHLQIEKCTTTLFVFHMYVILAESGSFPEMFGKKEEKNPSIWDELVGSHMFKKITVCDSGGIW